MRGARAPGRGECIYTCACTCLFWEWDRYGVVCECVEGEGGGAPGGTDCLL